MRIALRTSGGRGEYELAGRQGDVSIEDLFGRRMIFELTPEISIDGHAAARRMQGKPRIRLDDPRRYSHAYAILTAALLLPQPKRELRETSTEADFIHEGAYSITDIDIDVANVQDAFVALRPTRLWLRNASGVIRSVDVARRLAQVQDLWDAARSQDSDIGELVRHHEAAVISADHKAIKTACAALQDRMASGRDLLDQLSVSFGLQAQETAFSSATSTVPDETAESDVDPGDVARRTVAQWRKIVVRSPQGRAFSHRVRDAYSYRCALSGDFLPKLSTTASPGVDGAHILPWARYELNSLRNGICLNKLCHWAFDAGILRIDSDPQTGYVVSIPGRVCEEGLPMGMSLDYFRRIEGQIPPDRLPANENEWPSPLYLERLNAEVFG